MFNAHFKSHLVHPLSRSLEILENRKEDGRRMCEKGFLTPGELSHN